VETFLWLLLAVVVVIVGIFLLNRFYLKSTRDTALIRTGAGGQRVVLDGGIAVLPFLHRVDEINMRTQRKA
jgi:flotillin